MNTGNSRDLAHLSNASKRLIHNRAQMCRGWWMLCGITFYAAL